MSQLLVSTCLLLFYVTTFAFGQGLPMAVPEEVGVSAERLERIRPVMQGYIDDGRLPGFLTVVARHGKIVHFETIGMRDVENEKPIESDTIFRIYSMSKPITSVAVMILYEEGHFQLGTPVSKFIPEFENSVSLLSHIKNQQTHWNQSGISVGAVLPLPPSGSTLRRNWSACS